MYLHYYYTGHCEYYTPKYVCMYLPAKTTKCITPHFLPGPYPSLHKFVHAGHEVVSSPDPPSTLQEEMHAEG